MSDDKSVFLFASNISQAKPRSAQFKQLIGKLLKIVTGSKYSGILRLVPVYSNAEIIEGLRRYRARMAVLHFDGRREHFAQLLAASKASELGDLPVYLGKLKKLRFVFLSGCATEEFTKMLLDSGVPAVITSSNRLTVTEIELFADTVYEELLKGASLQLAFEIAKQSLGVEEGRNQRIFVNLRGIPDVLDKEFPKPEEFQPSTQSIADSSDGAQEPRKPQKNTNPQPDNRAGKSKSDINDSAGSIDGSPPPGQPPPPKQSQSSESERSRPPRNWKRPHPFVGNRPFTLGDGDIFYGREADIAHLSEIVRDTTTPPFILLSGQAGCGKTSLLQAGLRVELKDEFEVIELSGQSPPELVSVLRRKLTSITGKDRLVEAWQTIEGNHVTIKNMVEKRILLIIDNIDNIVNSQHPRERREILQLLGALSPIYAHTLTRPFSKIILSARTSEARDIRHIFQSMGMLNIEIPLMKISEIGLQEAIIGPFSEPSPGGVTLDKDAALQIREDLLKDSSSVQLPFLQATVQSLWILATQRLGPEAKITRADYATLYNSCKLLDNFLDIQLQNVLTKLQGKVDEYTLLRLLWLHASPHHIPTQRSMKDRHLQFPQLDSQLMLETLSALCDHYLLMTVPANKPAMLQIAHRELSPLVRERLIAMNEPRSSWRQRISILQSRRDMSFTLANATSKLPNAIQKVLRNENGELLFNRSDATLMLTVFALMLACILAGFLFIRLIS